MSGLTFPSLHDLLENRGIRRLQFKPASFLEDGYDFGFQWRGPGPLVYRLTWLGPIGRTPDSAEPGELYLLALGLANSGAAELLCVIPPVEGDPAANVSEILNGWEDVCGEPGSVDWVRDRVEEALRAGWATEPYLHQVSVQVGVDSGDLGIVRSILAMLAEVEGTPDGWVSREWLRHNARMALDRLPEGDAQAGAEFMASTFRDIPAEGAKCAACGDTGIDCPTCGHGMPVSDDEAI